MYVVGVSTIPCLGLNLMSNFHLDNVTNYNRTKLEGPLRTRVQVSLLKKSSSSSTQQESATSRRILAAPSKGDATSLLALHCKAAPTCAYEHHNLNKPSEKKMGHSLLKSDEYRSEFGVINCDYWSDIV